MGKWYRLIACLALVAIGAAACAPKAAPVLTGSPKHPDFMFPQLPDGTPQDLAARVQNGWAYLQADDLRSAEREFGAALKQRPAFAPAEAALGYAALARRNAKDAAAQFDRVLSSDNGYVPALVGRGQAMLELEQDSEALASFEAALARDPSLSDLRGRVDVLKFRATQALLDRAKAAADAGRLDEARSAYQQAIAGSPDSPFLYRELATVEQRAGRADEALEHYRKVIELDGNDAKALAGVGAILEGQGDIVGALAAYERANRIDAGEVTDATVARVRGRVALAKLPAEYRAIPNATAVTRADIAALIGNRLPQLVARAPQQPLIITDVRGHWAQAWITPVARAGIMEPLPNYQFDPAGRVRRGDLALVVSRLLNLIAAEKPEVASRWVGARVQVSDVPAGHLSYPAVSAAVASGVMPLGANGAFDLLKPVSGAEATDVMSRLEALARR